MGDKNPWKVKGVALDLLTKLKSGRPLDDIPSGRGNWDLLRGQSTLRSWTESYDDPPALIPPYGGVWGFDDPPPRRFTRLNFDSERGSMSLGLSYRSRVTSKLCTVDAHTLEEVGRESILEGTSRAAIESLDLLDFSPYSLSRSLYVLWDVAGVILEFRTGTLSTDGFRSRREEPTKDTEGKRYVEGSKDKEDWKSNELGCAIVTCGRAEGTKLMGGSEAGFKGR